MDLSKLFILELEAYSRLCTKRKDELFREMKLYSGDKAIRDRYHKLMSIDESVTEEIDKRLFELAKDNKKNNEENLGDN